MKVKLITLGCPKNLVDSEYIAGGLQMNGVELIDDATGADAVIINTCGFIESAKEESIETILQAVALKEQGQCKRVFVTGCLTERYGSEIRSEIPELDGVYGNRDMQKIVADISRELHLRQSLLGERRILTPGHYAYVKISEGCEHPCTFCAIPAIRGNFRSVPIPELVADAQRLVAGGVKELILIAQDTTIYGYDLDGTKQLAKLIRALAAVEGIEWLRLMYTYPYHMSDELIATIAEVDKVCKYIDMPVQHVSDRMLKRMARRVTGTFQQQLIRRLRQQIPDLALRTSVIVGFPGETEDDFAQLYDYVAEGHFDRLGVFTYSVEDGTPSASFPEQVAEEIKRERQDLLIQAQADIAEMKNRALVGRTLQVIVDEYDHDDGGFRGRTQWDCPEIDNSVLLRTGCRIGGLYQVRITEASTHDLAGEILRREEHKSDRNASILIPVTIA